jgi:hypothetical protein
MSNRKAPDRRRSPISSPQPGQSDINLAITELHHTIVRLNSVIDQVKKPLSQPAPLTPATNQKASGDLQQDLCLANLDIPKIFH